jgi:hypothetical protein
MCRRPWAPDHAAFGDASYSGHWLVEQRIVSFRCVYHISGGNHSVRVVGLPLEWLALIGLILVTLVLPALSTVLCGAPSFYLRPASYAMDAHS